MAKKIITIFSAILIIISGSIGGPAKAESDFRGQIVKMNGLPSLYYVAANGKRYVFPNANIYYSWFSDFNEVKTLSESDLITLPLGGNVLYRPGVLLIKINTDPKVYAVSRGGILRWIKTEAIARALYGDKWNKLVDDVPDSFFTNYTTGSAIEDAADYDPDNEANNTDSIDADYGLSTARAKRAHTRKCQMSGSARECRANDYINHANNSGDLKITGLNVTNNGSSGYIDTNDRITINFNKEIKPSSVNPELSAGGVYSSLDYGTTGSLTVSTEGVITIAGIAAFDIGSVEESGKFAVKIELSQSGKTLTLTIIGGADVRINDEDFDDTEQIGGIIKDLEGKTMPSDSDISKPSGSFGGVNVNDGIEPYITAITAYNYGEDGYVDVGDEIKVTFSEKIDPKSVQGSLTKDGSVNNVDAGSTGGVIIDSSGILKVTNIASFYVGDVDGGERFKVSLALDSEGKVLKITLAEGDRVALNNENFDNAAQIGGTIEDTDGNEMENDPNIDDPKGSFVADGSSDDPYITYVKAYDQGFPGYIDVDDQLVITFSSELDPESINNRLTLGGTIGDVELNDTGGIYINSNGLLTVTDILSFDVGEVGNADNFIVSLALSSSGKVLTITIDEGDAIEIKSETFGSATQLGGTIIDENDNVMDRVENIIKPIGTFGGDSTDTPPYITKIEVVNGNSTDRIDIHDTITVTFNEAINPESINGGLEPGSYIRDVDDNDTGGVYIADDGLLTITGISKFNVGNVADDSQFQVKLSLNSIGNILTITLMSGTDIELNYEDLSDAVQIGGTIEDNDGIKMENDPRITDPIGSF